MRLMRPATLAITTAILAVGCIRPIVPGTDGLERDPPRPAAGERPPTTQRQPPISRKRVVQKEPVATLIAKDGTWCNVSEDRYRMIKIGDNAWCGWTGG
jgi:hypothetical protein